MAPPDPKKKKKKKDRPSALTLFFCGEPPDEVALGEAIDCGLSSGERVRLYSWQDGTGFRAKKLVALEERPIGSQVELREAPHQQTLAEVMEVLFGDVVNAEKERRLRRTKEEEQNEIAVKRALREERARRAAGGGGGASLMCCDARPATTAARRQPPHLRHLTQRHSGITPLRGYQPPRSPYEPAPSSSSARRAGGRARARARGGRGPSARAPAISRKDPPPLLPRG